LTLAPSLAELLSAPGTPQALSEYKKSWDGWSGTIPTDRSDMWTIFYNYYLNAIQDNERSVEQIVDGAKCMALTGHLDLVPTFVGLTGLPEEQRTNAIETYRDSTSRVC
jgi:hypothetical protein